MADPTAPLAKPAPVEPVTATIKNLSPGLRVFKSHTGKDIVVHPNEMRTFVMHPHTFKIIKKEAQSDKPGVEIAAATDIAFNHQAEAQKRKEAEDRWFQDPANAAGLQKLRGTSVISAMLPPDGRRTQLADNPELPPKEPPADRYASLDPNVGQGPDLAGQKEVPVGQVAGMATDTGSKAQDVPVTDPPKEDAPEGRVRSKGKQGKKR